MSDFERGQTGSFEFQDEGAVLSPVETDLFLKRLNNELGMAQLRVRQARRKEIVAERAFMESRTPLLLDEDVPEVGRRAGQVTQKQQDAWFAARLPEEYWTLRSAQVERRNAVDYAIQVRDQMEIMRSLNKNASIHMETYRGGGR